MYTVAKQYVTPERLGKITRNDHEALQWLHHPQHSLLDEEEFYSHFNKQAYYNYDEACRLQNFLFTKGTKHALILIPQTGIVKNVFVRYPQHPRCEVMRGWRKARPLHFLGLTFPRMWG